MAGATGDIVEWPEEIGVDADGDQSHAVEFDAHVGVDVLDRVLTDHHDSRHTRGHLALHANEGVPATDRPPPVGVRRRVHLEHAVAGDRMVEGDDRRDLALESRDTPSEALVVVDEVELAEALGQVMVRAGAERERLREDAGGEHRGFKKVEARLELPEGRETAGVVVVEEVETAQFGERDALVEHRIGLATEDLDRVPKIAERLGEVTGVDALSTDVGLATVGEVGDAQGRVGVEPCGHPSEPTGG